MNIHKEKPHRSAAFPAAASRSAHVMADTLRMVMNVLDMTHFVMMRCGDGSERREQRGTGNQGKQAGNRLENGVHGSTLT